VYASYRQLIFATSAICKPLFGSMSQLWAAWQPRIREASTSIPPLSLAHKLVGARAGGRSSRYIGSPCKRDFDLRPVCPHRLQHALTHHPRIQAAERADRPRGWVRGAPLTRRHRPAYLAPGMLSPAGGSLRWPSWPAAFEQRGFKTPPAPRPSTSLGVCRACARSGGAPLHAAERFAAVRARACHCRRRCVSARRSATTGLRCYRLDRSCPARRERHHETASTCCTHVATPVGSPTVDEGGPRLPSTGPTACLSIMSGWMKPAPEPGWPASRPSSSARGVPHTVSRPTTPVAHLRARTEWKCADRRQPISTTAAATSLTESGYYLKSPPAFEPTASPSHVPCRLPIRTGTLPMVWAEIPMRGRLSLDE